MRESYRKNSFSSQKVFSFFCNKERFINWVYQTQRKSNIDPEVLRKWLLEEGMTLEDVAKKFKVSKERVRQIAKRYGISRSQRTPKWYAKRWGE